MRARVYVQQLGNGRTVFERDQVERLLVHRAIGVSIGTVEPFFAPAVGVKRTFVAL